MRPCITKSDHTCSLCNEVIKAGSNCLLFYAKNVSRGKSRPSYFVWIPTGWLHFRHWECQYKIRERDYSLEEFIAKIKKQEENRKHNRDLKVIAKQYKDVIDRALYGIGPTN